MAKEAVFNLKLEPELRDGFMAAAQAAHLPASQVMRDLRRDYIRQQQQAKAHEEFAQHKVAVARASVEAGRGRSNEEVEAAFAARRAKALGRMEASDVLVVTKLDRLGRNAIDVQQTVQMLEGKGIRVHCLALGGVDLTSAAGKDDYGRSGRCS